MENYSDQSYTVHVELDAHKVSIAVAVAFYSSRTNAVELIDYVQFATPKLRTATGLHRGNAAPACDLSPA